MSESDTSTRRMYVERQTSSEVAALKEFLDRITQERDRLHNARFHEIETRLETLLAAQRDREQLHLVSREHDLNGIRENIAQLEQWLTERLNSHKANEIQRAEARLAAHMHEHELNDRAVNVATASLDKRMQDIAHNLEERESLHMAAHAREHEMSESAILKADVNLSERLHTLNGMKETLISQASTFARSESVEERFKAIQGKSEVLIEANEKRITILERSASNLEGRLAMLGVFWVVVTVAIGIGMRFLK